MKELSVEEKARRYDEAIEKAEVLYKTAEPMSGCNVIIETLFPELKESDDERIRKEILVFMNKLDEQGYTDSRYPSWISWLEKQAEHTNFRSKIQIGDKVTRNRDGVLVNLSQLNRVAKPAAKVEPKFKIGDWITDGNITVQIEAIKNDCYLYCGDCVLYSTKTADKVYHLWTIQDAKNGDVLATPDYTLIFKESLKKDGGVSYCHYDFGAGNPQFVYIEDRNWYFGKEAIVHPATKEQRDILFQKMKEAGYMWDAEKKELKKIEQKTVQETKPFEAEHGKYYYCIKDYFCGGKKQASKGDVVQALRGLPIMGLKDASEYFLPVNFINCNSAWSEEDETTKNNISHIIRHYDKISKRENQPCYYVGDCLLWMQNIKDRVQPQPKQEWSEEDEEHIKSLLERLEGMCKKDATFIRTKFAVSEDEDWLKSLRPHSLWKPSDEQMVAINTAINVLGKGTLNGKQLIELQEQLKKLKGE